MQCLLTFHLQYQHQAHHFLTIQVNQYYTKEITAIIPNSKHKHRYIVFG